MHSLVESLTNRMVRGGIGASLHAQLALTLRALALAGNRDVVLQVAVPELVRATTSQEEGGDKAAKALAGLCTSWQEAPPAGAVAARRLGGGHSPSTFADRVGG